MIDLPCNVFLLREREREGETDRQTDRQAEREVNI